MLFSIFGVGSSDVAFSLLDQVAYLDKVDFGLKSVPDTLPRMLVWKGGKIREYADLDKCSGNSYGKRPQKRVSHGSKEQVIFLFS
jgi:hypothetical protein